MNASIILVILLIGISLFILDWILDKDYHINKNTISQYANGKYGYLTTFGFVFIGVGSILTGIKLFQSGLELFYRVVPVIVMLFGLFIGLLSVFRCDLPGKSTLRGMIHNRLAAIGLGTLTVGMVVFLVFARKMDLEILPTIILLTTDVASLSLLSFDSSKRRGIWERGAMFSQYFWILYLLFL